MELLDVLDHAADHFDQQPKLLAMALGFLLELWREQGAGSDVNGAHPRRRHAHIVSILREAPKFWQSVCYCLEQDVPEVPPLPTKGAIFSEYARSHEHNADSFAAVTQTRGSSAAWSPRMVTAHCFRLAARAAALHMVAIEMYREGGPPKALQQLGKAWVQVPETSGDSQGGRALHRYAAWLEQYRRFDYDSAISQALGTAAKEAGMHHAAFRVRGGDAPLSPPWWRYGGDAFVYSAPCIAAHLGMQGTWNDSRLIVTHMLEDGKSQYTPEIGGLLLM